MKTSYLTLMTSLLSASVLTVSLAHAGTTTVGSGTTEMTTALSSTDANQAFGILYQTGLATEYPAAQDIEVVNLNCNIDRLAVQKALNEGQDTGAGITCDGEVGGVPLHLQGDGAAKLQAILSDYANTQQFAQAEYVEVKSLSCSYDRIVAGKGGQAVTCSVTGL